MRKLGLGRMLMLLLFLAGVLVKVFSYYYVEYMWFNDLGYRDLFLTPVLARLEIGAVAFFIFFVILSLLGLIGYRVFLTAEREEIRGTSKLHLVIDSLVPPVEKDITPPETKKAMFPILAVSSVVSLFLALGLTENGWMKLLEYRNLTEFGLKELVFGRDVSFYVFKMPMYDFVLGSLMSSLAFVLLLSIVLFVMTGFIRLRGSIMQKGALYIPHSIRRFWAALVGIVFILVALKQYLSMFAVMYSQTGYVYGAGYTDIHVSVPMAKVLAVLALVCAAASFAYLLVNDHRMVLAAAVLFLMASFVGSIGEGLIQYTVSNNEFIKEKPYIEHELKFTKLAYNLNNIAVKDYPGTSAITMDNINNNRATIDNIRLNDPGALKTVLSQNQGLRYYYRFNDIDIDRYFIDDAYREVLLAPRELSEAALTEKAGTFVNLTMRYTHGYGAAATLANQIDDSGYARLIVKDIPPHSTAKGISIKEPRVYFGELTNDSTYGYVIGNTAAKEFDYPQGDNNVENNYTGSTGLAMSGLNRLFLSAYFNTFRFYVAGEINNDSKLLMRRNILKRVSTLMPYLKYDQDPYIVAAKDGKLYWMLDAYTSTDKFPYSAPAGDLNYIRNSVKVVIDPYNGTVNFYAFDKKDPILQTVSKIFPGVFKDAAELPSDLLQHIRYPEDYFNIQSNILLNFHVNNPSVFYNKEDTWDIAKKISDKTTANIEPYYSIMKLPGEKASEFVLMLPFTPASRQEQHRNNLVAWLAARSDGAGYGQLILYKVPKNVEVQGPLMIDSLIDQDTVISGKMTLWGQGGSQVIRGNLLAVPIDGGFIYVEPIYIRAEQQGASIPQMQAIVFAIDKKIIMVETKSLDTAMAQFFAREGAPPPGTGNGTAGGGPKVVNPKDAIMEKIESIKKQLQDLEEQVKSL